MPDSVCSQWRRSNVPHGVRACLRLCVVQPESWPNKISDTWRTCIIIMIGAYSAERIVSAMAPRTTRTGLTLRSSSRSMNARRTPRIFGVSNVIIAMTNSRIIRSLSNNGQRGNNDSSSVKYSNCTVAMWPAVPRPTTINANHNGEAR